MSIKLTYEEAYKELAAIANEIETEATSVDVLAEKVKRASDLITYCQQKLRVTEDEIGNIIKNIESTSGN